MAENTKARGANFTSAELNQLVASWLHVSQDPIVGNGQKIGAFWDRTLKHYNENKPQDRENRNVRSLDTKWSELKRDVAKYSGCFQTVKDRNVSGDSLDDTIRKSKELYQLKDSKGKEFVYIDQWFLLKDCQRFAMTVDDMAQKAAQKKARKQKGKGRLALADDKENETPNVENNIIDLGLDEASPNGQRVVSNDSSESLHFGECRPMGNKIAKKQRADESSTKIMAAAQRDMAIISAKRLKLAERQDRERLLTLRVGDLDEECQEYFRKCRAKELRIALLKLEREEEEDEARVRGTTRTPLPVRANPEAFVGASIPEVVASNGAEAGGSQVAGDPVDEVDREILSWD